MQKSIMYVEDDDSEALLVKTLLHQIDPAIQLERLSTVDAALQFFSGLGKGLSLERPPSLILLDLNLPPKNGHEVLSAVRGQKSLDNVPVVVFSSSVNSADKAKSFQLGAHAHICKPTHLTDYRGALRQIVGLIAAQTMSVLLWSL